MLLKIINGLIEKYSNKCDPHFRLQPENASLVKHRRILMFSPWTSRNIPTTSKIISW